MKETRILLWQGSDGKGSEEMLPGVREEEDEGLVSVARNSTNGNQRIRWVRENKTIATSFGLCDSSRWYPRR